MNESKSEKENIIFESDHSINEIQTNSKFPFPININSISELLDLL